jgi:hypothetical protein
LPIGIIGTEGRLKEGRQREWKLIGRELFWWLIGRKYKLGSVVEMR